MILRGDDQIERFHPGKLIRLRNEPVLERPALAGNRSLGIRGFVGGEHFVDRGVAHGVR
jgi:hypothetical protein